MLLVTLAALVAVSRSGIAPSPRPAVPSDARVSRATPTFWSAHCFHVWWLGNSGWPSTAGRLPNTAAAPQTPEGSPARKDAGQLPRTQPDGDHRLSAPSTRMVGPRSSSAVSWSSPTVRSAWFVQRDQPQARNQPIAWLWRLRLRAASSVLEAVVERAAVTRWAGAAAPVERSPPARVVADVRRVGADHVDGVDHDALDGAVTVKPALEPVRRVLQVARVIGLQPLAGRTADGGVHPWRCVPAQAIAGVRDPVAGVARARAADVERERAGAGG